MSPMLYCEIFIGIGPAVPNSFGTDNDPNQPTSPEPPSKRKIFISPRFSAPTNFILYQRIKNRPCCLHGIGALGRGKALIASQDSPLFSYMLSRSPFRNPRRCLKWDLGGNCLLGLWTAEDISRLPTHLHVKIKAL